MPRNSVRPSHPPVPRVVVLVAVAVVLLGVGYLVGRYFTSAPPVSPPAPESPIDASGLPSATSSTNGTGPGDAVRPYDVDRPYEEDLPDELNGAATGTDADLPTEIVLPPSGNGARIALVIDDLGRDLRDLDILRDLGVPVTYSVLPFEIRTSEVIDVLRARGAEILCHLPMEASGGANPGPGALVRSMTREELVDATRQALLATPGAVGVNNHMGSQLTSDAQALRPVLETLLEEGLFFLDSRTSAQSAGYRLASELGIATARRHVFLDPDPSLEAIRFQWRRLLDLAHRQGAAIAIGHPYDHTFQVLQEEVAAAREKGYEFVPVSYLLERPGGPE